MTGTTSQRTRAFAMAIAAAGLALTAYVEWAHANPGGDRFGWFVYESVAWLALLGIGPFLPVPATVLAGALLALALEAVAYWQVFVVPGGSDAAALYLWKPLAQLALLAAAWFAGYLLYLRNMRARAHG